MDCHTRRKLYSSRRFNKIRKMTVFQEMAAESIYYLTKLNDLGIILFRR